LQPIGSRPPNFIAESFYVNTNRNAIDISVGKHVGSGARTSSCSAPKTCSGSSDCYAAGRDDHAAQHAATAHRDTAPCGTASNDKHSCVDHRATDADHHTGRWAGFVADAKSSCCPGGYNRHADPEPGNDPNPSDGTLSDYAEPGARGTKRIADGHDNERREYKPSQYEFGNGKPEFVSGAVLDHIGNESGKHCGNDFPGHSADNFFGTMPAECNRDASADVRAGL
jgi:hypothetical protein